mgnify:CR=1|jgi:hypothetical protein
MNYLHKISNVLLLAFQHTDIFPVKINYTSGKVAFDYLSQDEISVLVIEDNIVLIDLDSRLKNRRWRTRFSERRYDKIS